MASHVNLLVVERVIGDVVDMFVPTVPMSVRFGTKDLTNGCDVKPSIAIAAPTVQIVGRANDLFTLVSIVLIHHNLFDQLMTDPDAPSPSEPSMREWLHWLVVNIPGGSDPSQATTFVCLVLLTRSFAHGCAGEAVVPYMGPQRLPIGIHRYVLAVYQQKARMTGPPALAPADQAARERFSSRAFASRHDLGRPVAAMYFNAQMEIADRRGEYRETVSSND
ncbi:Protein MOTHER of FT and TFL1-like protein 1 [Dichanthelium oligosanthes]|uniref:Protein MOTHER of FT and TFL1-like protein 1 n=1 Tax=Dichanthelium oligosanthes TaxID=888268 RepID=A0A1E5VXF3_9POAL|nr:Protein MOTHER of FT and TFL1-like protein 1 [Dichanthelium oligosanthes]